MSDIETESVQWLWEPYIGCGNITIIQGDPGTGKTILALAIAAALTTGAPLPGCCCCAASESVIYQTAEDGLANTIKPRLEQLGADCRRVHVIDEGEKPLSLADARIEEAIIKMSAKLFIIDPLQAYLGGADMHSANGVRPLMKQLSAAAGRTGCAIVIIAHLNKKGGKSQYRGLGSIDIYAAARNVLTVGTTWLDDNMRAVVHNKSNLAPPGVSLAFELDPAGGFRWRGECSVSIDDLLNGGKQVQESQFAKARRLIENALAHGAVMSADMFQMAEDQGISAKTLNRAKDALGVISVKRHDRWYWELPIDLDEAVYTQGNEETQDGHAGHHTQGGQAPALTALTMLPDGWRPV